MHGYCHGLSLVHKTCHGAVRDSSVFFGQPCHGMIASRGDRDDASDSKGYSDSGNSAVSCV